MIEIASKHATGADYRLVPDARKAIELFMARLADVALPEISRILLYGSHARGDDQVDSDIDIAVVLAGSDPGDGTQFKLLMRLADISSRIMLEMDRPMDVAAIIVWENEFIEPDKQYNPHFYRNVLADGIEIQASRGRVRVVQPYPSLH